MKPKVIHTEAELEAALQRIDALMENDPDPASPEGEELELLSLLVERYEEEKYPMDLPSPMAAIQFRMEQQGLKPKDLVQYLGRPARFPKSSTPNDR
jgi:HTH-type transcriptional regulator/antitoxin HigA